MRVCFPNQEQFSHPLLPLTTSILGDLYRAESSSN